jgi:hypothetical protein
VGGEHSGPPAEGEGGAAFVLGILDPNLAAMAFDQLLDEREAEPAAFDAVMRLQR